MRRFDYDRAVALRIQNYLGRREFHLADDNAHQSSETLPDPPTEFPEEQHHNEDKDRQSEPLRGEILVADGGFLASGVNQ